MKQKPYLKWIFPYLLILFLTLLISFVAILQSSRIIAEISLFGHKASLKQLQVSIDVFFQDVKEITTELRYFKDKMTIKPVYEGQGDDDMFMISRITDYLTAVNMTRKEIIPVVSYRGQILTGDAVFSPEEYYAIYLRDSDISEEEWIKLLNSRHQYSTLELTLTPPHLHDREYLGIFASDIYLHSDFSEQGTILILASTGYLKDLAGRNLWLSLGDILILDKSGKTILSTYEEENEKIGEIPECSNHLVRQGDYYYIGVKSEVMDWVYISRYPYSLFQKNSRQLRHLSISLLILSVFLGGILSWYFARRSYRPFERMASILSPFQKESDDRDNIENLLTSVKQVVSEHRSALTLLSSHQPLIMKDFLISLASARIDGDENETIDECELRLLCREKGLVFPENYFYIMAVQSENDCSMKELEESLPAIIQEQSWVFDYHGDILVLINSSGYTKEKAEVLFNEYRRELQQKNNQNFSFGISGSFLQISELGRHVEEALTAVEHRIVLDDSQVIFYRPFMKENPISNVFNLGTELRFINSIRLGDYQIAGETIKRALSNMKSRNKLPLKFIKLRMYGLLNLLLDGIGEMRFDLSDDFLDQLDPVNRLANCDTLREIENEMDFILSRVIDFTGRVQEKESTSLVERVDRFIQENLDNSGLSVAMISESFNVSASNLSTSYKSMTGSGLLEAIHRKRIYRAKELMGNSEYSLKDISRMVGYNNDIAFNRAFKRYEGMTPGQFRKEFSE